MKFISLKISHPMVPYGYTTKYRLAVIYYSIYIMYVANGLLIETNHVPYMYVRSYVANVVWIDIATKLSSAYI